MSVESEHDFGEKQMHLLAFLVVSVDNRGYIHDDETLSSFLGVDISDLHALAKPLLETGVVGYTTCERDLLQLQLESVEPAVLNTNQSWTTENAKRVLAASELFTLNDGQYIERGFYFIRTHLVDFLRVLLDLPWEENSVMTFNSEQSHAPDFNFARSLLYALFSDEPDSQLTADHQEFLRLFNEDRRSSNVASHEDYQNQFSESYELAGD